MKTALIIAASIAAAAVVGWLSWKSYERSSPTVAGESPEDRLRSIEAAFLPSVDGGGEAVVLADDDAELRPAAEGFFRELGAAFTASDKAKLSALVSGELMFNYAERSGALDLGRGGQRARFFKGFNEGVGTGLARASGMLAFEEFDVPRIEKIRDNEMVAYVRWWNDDLEIYTKMRWWLLKGLDGNWVAYDYEDFDQNLRASVLIGAMLSEAGGGKMPWMDDFGELVSTFQGLAGVEAVESLPEKLDMIDRLLTRRLPEGIEGFARIIRASALMIDGRTEDALDELERVDKITRGAPIVFYQRGACLTELGRYKEALVAYERYGDMLGWDSDLREMVADCYYGAGDVEKALEQVEAALAEQPNAVGCLCTLALCLPAERLAELAGRVEKTRNPEEAYELILDYAIQEGRTDVVKGVFGQLQKAYPDSDLIEYYEGEIEDLEKEDSERAELSPAA